MAVEGWMFDHKSGARHWVAVEARGFHLILSSDTGSARTIDPERLKPIGRERGAEVYTLRGEKGFRLGLNEIDDPLVEARLPEFTLAEQSKGSPLFWIPICLIVIGAAVFALMPLLGTVPNRILSIFG